MQLRWDYFVSGPILLEACRLFALMLWAIGGRLSAGLTDGHGYSIE